MWFKPSIFVFSDYLMNRFHKIVSISLLFTAFCVKAVFEQYYKNGWVLTISKAAALIIKPGDLMNNDSRIYTSGLNAGSYIIKPAVDNKIGTIKLVASK